MPNISPVSQPRGVVVVPHDTNGTSEPPAPARQAVPPGELPRQPSQRSGPAIRASGPGQSWPDKRQLPPFLKKIIEWLRVGYPEGVPDVDYILLFALLGSQLTDDEVNAIAHELETESKPESAEAIRHAIMAVTSDQRPNDADIARVRARLAAGGWPLAHPDRTP